MELAWRARLTDSVMPFMVQYMRDTSKRIASLEAKLAPKEAEDAAAAAAAAAGGMGAPGMGGMGMVRCYAVCVLLLLCVTLPRLVPISHPLPPPPPHTHTTTTRR